VTKRRSLQCSPRHQGFEVAEANAEVSFTHGRWESCGGKQARSDPSLDRARRDSHASRRARNGQPDGRRLARPRRQLGSDRRRQLFGRRRMFACSIDHGVTSVGIAAAPAESNRANSKAARRPSRRARASRDSCFAESGRGGNRRRPPPIAVPASGGEGRRDSGAMSGRFMPRVSRHDSRGRTMRD